ncbi:TadE/TadG family type IV pilus assembly protein [Spirillospora sp. CA-108201]
MSRTPAGGRPAPGARDAGTAVVEFAAVLPIAGVGILLCLQALVAVVSVERVQNAARTGARVAAQRQDPGACPAAARDALPGWAREPRAEGTAAGDGVSCAVTVRTPLLFPGVPLDLEFSRTVHMPRG